jgi:alpha-galactosidase/6-phospho-beta-glucosidase family protein
VLSTPLTVDIKGSKTTVQGDANVIPVDYSNNASIKHALTGVDVVISTIPIPALDVQEKIAAAAKEADVKLFVPSEYGLTNGKTEGVPGVKANIRGQLRTLGMPYAAFYTGVWSDFAWVSYVS